MSLNLQQAIREILSNKNHLYESTLEAKKEIAAYINDSVIFDIMKKNKDANYDDLLRVTSSEKEDLFVTCKIIAALIKEFFEEKSLLDDGNSIFVFVESVFYLTGIEQNYSISAFYYLIVDFYDELKLGKTRFVDRENKVSAVEYTFDCYFVIENAMLNESEDLDEKEQLTTAEALDFINDSIIAVIASREDTRAGVDIDIDNEIGDNDFDINKLIKVTSAEKDDLFITCKIASRVFDKKLFLNNCWGLAALFGRTRYATTDPFILLIYAFHKEEVHKKPFVEKTFNDWFEVDDVNILTESVENDIRDEEEIRTEIETIINNSIIRDFGEYSNAIECGVDTDFLTQQEQDEVLITCKILERTFNELTRMNGKYFWACVHDTLKNLEILNLRKILDCIHLIHQGRITEAEHDLSFDLFDRCRKEKLDESNEMLNTNAEELTHEIAEFINYSIIKQLYDGTVYEITRRKLTNDEASELFVTCKILSKLYNDLYNLEPKNSHRDFWDVSYSSLACLDSIANRREICEVIYKCWNGHEDFAKEYIKTTIFEVQVAQKLDESVDYTELRNKYDDVIDECVAFMKDSDLDVLMHEITKGVDEFQERYERIKISRANASKLYIICKIIYSFAKDAYILLYMLDPDLATSGGCIKGMINAYVYREKKFLGDSTHQRSLSYDLLLNLINKIESYKSLEESELFEVKDE